MTPAGGASRFLHSQIDTLPAIAVIETGRDFPLTTLKRFPDRTHALFDLAAARYPVRALAALDRASRAWLKRWENAHLDEIDEVARTLNRPGAYFFSVNYEWGCTCRVSPSADRTSARLIRVLDWMTPGLGRHLIAARVSGAPAGPFVTLTWPGYTGVLQAMAPQRFSVSLNQAPMRRATGFYYLDWAAGRRRVWSMPHPTPAHLLRHVVEHAHSFKEAREMLIEKPISTPAIFSIAGLKTQDTAVIERTEMDARVRDGVHVAANHWEAPGWRGHARGADSPGRAKLMHTVVPEFDPRFPWLKPPILNERTRIALIADAKAGRVMAQGFEGGKPATEVLDLMWRLQA
jgi:hypothetical protein